MKFGSVIQATSIISKAYDENGKVRSALTYKAEKGRCYVFVCLGYTATNGEVFDPEQALNDMGWVRKDP